MSEPAAGWFTVRPDHPCLPGHFPGDPVVPGVVLLDETFAAIGEALASAAGRRVERILSAKFAAPVRPGERVDVFCECRGDSLAFSCRVAGAPVLTGRARLRGAP